MINRTALLSSGALALACLLFVGCGDDSTVPTDSAVGDSTVGDSSVVDSSRPDSTVSDSSVADSSVADSTVGDSGSTDASADASTDASTDAGDAASGPTVSIEWVASIAGTPLAGATVELLDLSDFSIVLGTGTSDASGISTITLTTLPIDRYVAHATLAGQHDTYFYAPDNHTDAPTVTGVPMVSNTVWDATYTGASITEMAGTGWILVRGRTAAGAGVTDMTLASSSGGSVAYLSGGLLHMGTSSPDGEALILNAEATAATLTVAAGGSMAMSPVIGIADATIATIITIP